MAGLKSNPNAAKNLKPCKPGETHNPNGRPTKLVNAIKKLPKDMQEKVYGVLAFALTLPDETSAKKYLESKQGELGQYGFVLQIAIKQLLKEGWGWSALMDIMDRYPVNARFLQEHGTFDEGIDHIMDLIPGHLAGWNPVGPAVGGRACRGGYLIEVHNGLRECPYDRCVIEHLHHL